MTKLWRHRWLRAALVAVAVSVWPACALDSPPDGAIANLDFVLKDATGKDVHLADYKGRPMVVNFWATWCGPCKVETPWLVEFDRKYRDRKLAVIGVSIDDPSADVLKFASEYQVPYPMLIGLGQDKLIAAFDAADVIPVTWFIRADGTVRTKAKGIHSKEWIEAEIQGLF